MEKTLVSVVTPSYNQAAFIEETILSVKDQDCPNLEHIVVDGGSTDGTLDILRRFEREYNLRWISEKDRGQTEALNKGFRMAQGAVIGWLNSDDTYLPGTVSKAIEQFNQHDHVGWVYGDGCWVDESGDILRVWKSRPFDLGALVRGPYYIVQPTIFFRRELFSRIGFLNEALDYTMDTEFVFRLGLASEASYIPQILATRRLHSGAKSANRTPFAKEYITILKDLYARSDLPSSVIKAKNEAFCRAYLMAGSWHFANGDLKASRDYLVKSLRQYFSPFSPLTWKAFLFLLQSYLNVRWVLPGEVRKLS